MTLVRHLHWRRFVSVLLYWSRVWDTIQAGSCQSRGKLTSVSDALGHWYLWFTAGIWCSTSQGRGEWPADKINMNSHATPDRFIASTRIVLLFITTTTKNKETKINLIKLVFLISNNKSVSLSKACLNHDQLSISRLIFSTEKHDHEMMTND